MILFKNYIYIILLLSNIFVFGSIKYQDDNGVGYDFDAHGRPLFRIGDYEFPSNPMNDRAKGYSIQGKVKNGVLNFGAYIDWDYNPSGAWGQYAYLPSVAFMAGVPGYIPFNNFEDWTFEDILNSEDDNITVWISSDAFSAWNQKTEYNENLQEYVPSRFSGIAYNIEGDRGDVALQRSSLQDLGTERYYCTVAITEGEENQENCENAEGFINGEWVQGQWIPKPDLTHYALDSTVEWFMDLTENKVYFVMLDDAVNPAITFSMGLIFPWAFRPKFESRFPEYDKYDYGLDLDEWTDDDNYTYYGATTSESWMSRWNPKTNTDWHASTGSSQNTHSNNFTSGDIFGNTDFTDSDDPFPLLAHSNYPTTWPTAINPETLEEVPYWPGWYADEYFGDLPPELMLANGIDPALCDNQSRSNPDCWKELPGRFTSDSDIFMQFDDRWAHRGNNIEDNEYQQTGYPMGLTVSSMVHSYGVSYAEDVMFVTVRVRNESGDYDIAFKKDKNGDEIPLKDSFGNFVSGEGMIMPDGTKLNGGKGFDYENVAMGFYMDADVLMGDLTGYQGSLHTNNDDFMEYYDCKSAPEGCPVIDGEELRISMSMFYDYDGESGGVTGYGFDTPGVAGGGGLGIVATQLLDSPYSSDYIDLDNNGTIDIIPGDRLKMTDWHWFDWYNRPGVVTREGDNNCCAGDPGKAQARNKEEIQYKILAGDASNLSNNEDTWFFHLPDPNEEENNATNPLNPHFDSLEGLKETEFFLDGPEGLDCVSIMSCSPFSLDVGEEVNFSFCIIFGEDKEDLLRNAEFAQIMYNARYQGYSSPLKPKVAATTSHNQIKLHWTNTPETSKDVITSYTDFEGYKIYKSRDGGITWGEPVNKIYDATNTFVGWQPYQQFDLSSDQDKAFCVKGFEDKCYINSAVDETISSKADCDEINGIWRNFDDTDQDGLWSPGEVYNCVEDDTCIETDECTRQINVNGLDPQAPWFSLGTDSGFDSIIPCSCSEITKLTKTECEADGFEWNCDFYQDEEGEIYNYTFVDNDVIDGIEYTYSITAYDTGVMSDVIEIIETDNGWAADTISVPDPNNWGDVNAFQMLENSKGSTEYDDNFVKAIPGFVPTNDWNNVQVVPNPFILHSDYETNDYELKWMITGLPSNCTVKIHTVTGELVNEFVHSDEARAFRYWDLRNKNNQEIAPGLYFYTIEDLTSQNKEPYIGKFVVIR